MNTRHFSHYAVALCALMVASAVPTLAQDRSAEQARPGAPRVLDEGPVATEPSTDDAQAAMTTLSGTPILEVENAGAVKQMRLNEDGGFVIGGVFGTGVIPASDAGTRLMWFPAKAAFRVGYVSLDQWNAGNIGDYSMAMGYNTRASALYSTAMGYITRASGRSATAMGEFTFASALYSTAMGYGTTASGNYSTAMGALTTSSNPYSTAMGYQTTASGDYSTAMGRETTASGSYSTAMGVNSIASGWTSFAMGDNTTASGLAATVAGGSFNVAQGNYSFAAGRRAKANNVGCFVWGDSSTADLSCNVSNRWLARSSGGVYFFTNSALSSGVFVGAGGNAWSSVSDRARKENLAPVDGQEVLARLADLPLATWNYLSEDVAVRHMGPMAQDFYAAYGLGDSDQHISTIDADGVALAAIQGLYEIVQAQEDQIVTQRAEIDSLEVRLAALEAERAEENLALRQRLAAIEAALATGSPQAADATSSIIIAGND
jgi:hypothetical protein